MNEERATVSHISGPTDFFNACEIGDLEYVKYVVNDTKREWSKFKIFVLIYSRLILKDYIFELPCHE